MTIVAESIIEVMVPCLGPEEAEAVARVVAGGWIAEGLTVARFEEEFARVMRAPYAVAVASGSAALQLALIVAGVRPGDDVVVPSLAFIATANAVRHVGATPVFADVDPHTGTVTGATIESVLTPVTTAVVVVDHAGIPVDLEDIRDVTDPLGIIVIEDAACAAGSTYRARPVGATAEVTAWSFSDRSLLTTGEGGMLSTSHARWATRARRLRGHAKDAAAQDGGDVLPPPAEEYVEVGWDCRMTDLQAAVGLVQLMRLPAILRRRREIADRYRRELQGVPGLRLVADPAWGTGNDLDLWVEVERVYPLERDQLLAALHDAGVFARRGTPAAHRQAPYRSLTPPEGLPGTDRLTDGTLVLPVHHALTDAEQGRVIAVLTGTRRAVATAAEIVR